MTLDGASSPASAGAPHGAAPAPVDVSQARHLIEQANARHDIQTSFLSTPKADPKDAEWLIKFFHWVGGILQPLFDLFKPLAPAVPYLAYILIGVAILLLLSPVVRLFITTRFERIFRPNLKADTPWRPSREAVAALLEEIDALAARGEYDEAVHLLLMRSVADVNAYRPDLVRKHFSARDIGDHPLLPESARPAFREIVAWVEKSYFAGVPVGKAGFDACRAAYVAFVSAEGLA